MGAMNSMASASRSAQPFLLFAASIFLSSFVCIERRWKTSLARCLVPSHLLQRRAAGPPPPSSPAALGGQSLDWLPEWFLAPIESGIETIAFAPIGGASELHRLTVPHKAGLLHAQHRRRQAEPQMMGLRLIGQARPHGHLGRGHSQAVGLLEHGIEGNIVRHPLEDSPADRVRQMRGLQDDRDAVGFAQAVDADDFGARLDLQAGGDGLGGLRQARLEDDRAGGAPLTVDALTEAKKGT